MEADPRLFLMADDQGIDLLEPFFEKFPERAMDIGIAEQNLIGMAAGLANAGFHPVVYGISNFMIHRCMEQIRNDVCLHNHPVLVVGISAGYDHGGLGATHHAIDDIGCVKPLPNIAIYSPSSDESMAAIFEELKTFRRPTYLRIAKEGWQSGIAFDGPNHFIVDRLDATAVIISHGKMVQVATVAATIAVNAGHGIFSVFAMDQIKPVDEKALLDLAKRFKTLVFAEDNFKSGLYNSACQVFVEHGLHNKVIFIGPQQEKYEEYVGNLPHLLDKYGLTAEKIAERMRTIAPAK